MHIFLALVGAAMVLSIYYETSSIGRERLLIARSPQPALRTNPEQFANSGQHGL